jgi:hypothetical protein
MDYVAHDEDDRQRNEEGNIGPCVDEAILPPAPRAGSSLTRLPAVPLAEPSCTSGFMLLPASRADAYARFANSLII